MKRMTCVVAALLLLLGLLPDGASAKGSKPVIALDHTPAYNETSPFTGVIYTEDGSAFNPADYRVTLYLQLSENGTYWVKPTYATPYASVQSDASFSIRYVTGGYDEEAKILHIMLIPASYTPTSSFSETKDIALDYVRVDRTEDGGVTVTPKRPLPGNVSTATPTQETTAFERKANAPFITLDHIPAYNDSSSVTGVIFSETDASFNPSDYRITLYLQLFEGDSYWVKPTFATPYASVQSDGSFSIRYATGGYDREAKLLHIMLIPASYTPTSDFDAAKEMALDYVKVERAEDGSVKVTPETPPFKPAKEPNLPPVSENKIAVNIGFYTADGSEPGDALSEELIRQHLNAVAGFADTVRFYGASGELAKVYPIARSMGFSIVGSAWLCGDQTADRAEMDALIEHCNNGYVDVAVVGSETLLRNDLTPEALAQDMEYVRSRLTDKNIAVTTSDGITPLLRSAVIRNACEILMPTYYPYWSGVHISQAAEDFVSNLNALREVSGRKTIVASEVGWPTQGQTIMSAHAGEEEAGQYFEAIRAWSLETGTRVLYFDSADEGWKRRDEGECGAHWGMMNNQFVLKDCYKGKITAGFTDVSPKSNYAEAIRWAVENNITQGTSQTMFSPDTACTQNHILTFLWRANGSPSTSIRNPSLKVNANTDFGKAALWAYQQGLISDSYNGNIPCSRAATMMFLWKLAGSPNAGSVNFSDVPPNANYNAAVAWAVSRNITNGTSDTTFSPNVICTRGQIVTFLYRYYAAK